MCDRVKCWVGNHGSINPREITIFTAKWCGACKTQVPRILERAASAGFNVKLIDVDSEDPEDRRRASCVRFVPHIEYMDQEISLGEFEKLISRALAAASGKLSLYMGV